MTPYQRFVVAALAFLQFTVVLDFMILSPLGAVLMKSLSIGPQQFGVAVSAYAFAAGTSGLLAAGFADRFDRKKLLLFFYTGFVVGTFLCGLAPTYGFLVAARVVTGLFGGVIASISFAITTDLFPLAMRGRVMGIVQTAFAASQVLGIPAGLWFSNRWGWHAPFLFIVAVSVVVGVVIAAKLRPIDGHLKAGEAHAPAVAHLRAVLGAPRYLTAFGVTATLATGGFMIMPFSSAFAVGNLGVPLAKLPLVYLVTGAFSIVAGPLVGRAADRYGTFRTFVCGTVVTVGTVLVYTHLGRTPLPLVMLVSVVMFVGISARIIASQALVSAVPTPATRGAFMSVSSSLQQISGGLAAALSGAIVAVGPGGEVLRFDVVGWVVVAAALVTLFLLDRVRRRVPEAAPSPTAAASAPG